MRTIEQLFEGYLYSSNLRDKYAMSYSKSADTAFAIENITDEAYNGNYTKDIVVWKDDKHLTNNGWGLLGIRLYFSWVDVSRGLIKVQDPSGIINYIDPLIKEYTMQKRSPDALYNVTIGCRLSELIPIFEYISSFDSIEALKIELGLKENKQGDISIIGK